MRKKGTEPSGRRHAGKGTRGGGLERKMRESGKGLGWPIPRKQPEKEEEEEEKEEEIKTITKVLVFTYKKTHVETKH